MSRIGRQPIVIPAGVTAKVDGREVTITGPKGTLSMTVAEPIVVSQEEGQLVVTRPDDERDSRARHGLTRTLVANMVTGVTTGYEKGLEIVGTGYRVAAKGTAVNEVTVICPPQRSSGHGLNPIGPQRYSEPPMDV